MNLAYTLHNELRPGADAAVTAMKPSDARRQKLIDGGGASADRQAAVVSVSSTAEVLGVEPPTAGSSSEAVACVRAQRRREEVEETVSLCVLLLYWAQFRFRISLYDSASLRAPPRSGTT